MPGYVIASIDMHDPEGMKAYSAAAPSVVKKYGGRYLARGNRLTNVEGEFPTRAITILEFPSLADAQTFWNSPEYAACKALRQNCATGRVAIYEATPGENPVPDYLK